MVSVVNTWSHYGKLNSKGSGYCRGLNDYLYSDSIFFIQLQYHLLQTDRKIALVIIEAPTAASYSADPLPRPIRKAKTSRKPKSSPTKEEALLLSGLRRGHWQAAGPYSLHRRTRTK